MAPLYLLDTNILIAALKGHAAVRQRLENTPLDGLRLSAIVLGELEFGAEKSAQVERNRRRLAELTQRLPVVRAALERAGVPIGANDLWIAAQALQIGAVLVSDNQREFRRVPDLLLENGLEPARS
jgi:tRNA(fMet)-specific endonuclease VapC